MSRAFLKRFTVGLPFVVAATLAHAAAEPAWLAAEFERRGQPAYQLVVDAREAGALDQPGSGWRRTGAIVHAYGFPEGDFNVPVCRVSQGETTAYAMGSGGCPRVANAYGVTLPNVFYLAKAGAGGACVSGERVWALPHPNNPSLYARIGAGDPVPGMGVAKGQLVWGLCAPKSARMRRMEAARLLDQASFGATAAAIDTIADGVGAKAWVEQQLAMAPTRYTQYPTFYRLSGTPDPACTYTLADGTPASAASQKCARETFSPELVQREFYWQATEGPDQLRQRVAWAWSQLFVVSGVKEGMAYGMADYQQKLRDLAFGRFQDLLYTVSTHPMMGRMLDNEGNAKAQGLRQPSENFARELLQLFTLGTTKLNPDGSPVMGPDGLPQPVYGQETISEMARAMTGWVQAPSAPPAGRQPGNLRDPMVPNENNHDTGAKSMFGGAFTVPPGMDAANEMRRVLGYLAEHPNTAVFVSRYLIQRLVTSNPSGAYLERVSGAFRDNGNGVVGDMAAVIKAILLDPEARGAMRPEESYGRARDNVQRYVGLMRALNTRGSRGGELMLPWQMRADPFNAPSVFGYFLADYRLDSALYGPEFNANRASTVLDWASVVAQRTATDVQSWNWDWVTPGGSSDVSHYVAMAGDVNRLVDQLNLTFAAGSMSPAMVGGLADILSSYRPWGSTPSPDMLARTALFLFFSSAQYHVQR